MTDRDRRTEVAVVRRLSATQFWPDMKPWPERIDETWAEMPTPKTTRELREMSQHDLLQYGRQREADGMIVRLHADGFQFFIWLDVGSAVGLNPGHWIVRDGDHFLEAVPDEVFRKGYIEVRP